jgi:hydroxymethylpyrimidine/phosphomethylpyrimidine kinase
VDSNSNTPTVLTLSGLDPQGSAGVSADILSINNAQSVALPVITNLTVQNTQKVLAIHTVDSDIIIQQFNAIIQDSTIDIIKIGLITNENSKALEYILSCTSAKVILDPIIKSSTHNTFTNKNILQTLLPRVFMITPNAYELESLTGEKNQETAIQKLNIPWVVLTQTDNSVDIITHKLFHNATLVKEFSYQKLAGNYHGSGCVLSSTIAGKLATLEHIETIHNADIVAACEYGFNYTYQTLLHAIKIGKMQFSPNHFFNTL